MYVIVLTLLLLTTHGCLSGQPEDPEQMEKSLAETNLRHFHESLLKDAIFPDRDNVSPQELQRALESPEGQELARSAAMQEMLDETRSNSGERSRAMFWLSSMCDTAPWLSWLVNCDEDTNEIENRENPSISTSPFLIALDNFQWARCTDTNDLQY